MNTIRLTLLFLFSALLFVGCGGKRPDKANNLPIKPEYVDQLSGEWVVPAYRDKLIETGSELSAFKALEGIGAVSVYPAQGDSIEIMILYNNHEGFGGVLRPAEPGRNAGFSPLHVENGVMNRQYEIGMESEGDSLKLLLYEYDTETDSVHKVTFERITPDGGPTTGPECVAAQVIYAGKYEVTDSKGKKGRDVQLFPDLRITGMDDAVHYGILTDFALPSIEMFFLRAENQSIIERFGVQRTDYGFELYEVVDDPNSGFEKFGKHHSRWTRIKE